MAQLQVHPTTKLSIKPMPTPQFSSEIHVALSYKETHVSLQSQCLTLIIVLSLHNLYHHIS